MAVESLEQLAFALVAITNAALADTAGGSELTFPQWRVLVVLGNGDRALRLRELASAISASPPSASRLVRRLERRGLVEAHPDPVDRRGLLVTLSPRGRSVRAGVVERRRQLIAESLAAVGPLPAGSDDGLRAIVAALARWV